MDLDERLSGFEERLRDDREPEEGWFGALAAIVMEMNGAMTEITTSGAVADIDEQNKIERWVDRLHRVAGSVADKVEARGFSITVGFPAGVRVTLEWHIS